jgi:chromosome segregation ATPase
MKNTIAAVLSAILLAGCALKQMRDDNIALRHQISQKEEQLHELEVENRQLAEKERLLMQKLETGKLNLNQLESELDELIRENQQLVRLKNEHQKNVNALEHAIDNMKKSRKKITELQQQDAALSLKNKKIKALREEIRQYLKIGLKEKYRPVSEQSHP